MSEWISIHESTPEGDCLVFLAEESLGRRIHSARMGKVKIIGHHFAWDIGEVTHWMPLPEPPKN